MSDDLTRRIKRIIYPPPFRDGDETIRAIAALIAEERARAFEEAAGWHDAQADELNVRAHQGGPGSVWASEQAPRHLRHAAAISALAKKETGQ